MINVYTARVNVHLNVDGVRNANRFQDKKPTLTCVSCPYLVGGIPTPLKNMSQLG